LSEKLIMLKLTKLKTVALATVLGLLSFNFYSSQNQIRRQLITKVDPLRVAVFGSSHSWGASLEERFKAYPYRLSPTVDNFAYFASGLFHCALHGRHRDFVSEQGTYTFFPTHQAPTTQLSAPNPLSVTTPFMISFFWNIMSAELKTAWQTWRVASVLASPTQLSS
jgi:hypothetical protein